MSITRNCIQLYQITPEGVAQPLLGSFGIMRIDRRLGRVRLEQEAQAFLSYEQRNTPHAQGYTITKDGYTLARYAPRPIIRWEDR